MHRRIPLLAIAFVALALSGCASSTGSSDGVVGTTIDGQAFDLAAHAGKPVVLNFWASWCGYCRLEMPELVAFAADHPEASVIGVAVDDDEASARAVIEEFSIPFPTVWDPRGEIFAEFESQGLPTTVFLNAELDMVHKIVGATDRAGFEAGLQKAQ